MFTNATLWFGEDDSFSAESDNFLSDDDFSDIMSVGDYSESDEECGGNCGEPETVPVHPRLHSFLHLNPCSKEERRKLNNDDIIKEIHEDPLAATIKCHRNVCVKSFNRPYPLHMAIALGASADAVDALHNSFPRAINEKCNFKGSQNTPLHLACIFKASFDVVSFLLEKCPGAAEEKGSFGHKPLHCAIRYNAPLDVVMLLLKNQTKTIREKDDLGRTYLHHACEYTAEFDVVRLIFDEYPEAVMEKNDKGNTPLHEACISGSSLEVVRMLLEKNPTAPFEKNYCGETLLHAACMRDEPLDILPMLLTRFPAIVKESNNWGWTPIHLAIEHSLPLEVVSLMIEKFPEALRQNFGDGVSLLHHACFMNAPFEVVSMLLKRFPEAIMRKNDAGYTPLEILQQQRAVSCCVAKMCANVNQLLCNKTDISSAATILNTFAQKKWRDGVAICLDVQPSIRQSLDMNSTLLPYFLSYVGRNCKMLTMWEMISNMQDVLTTVD